MPKTQDDIVRESKGYQPVEVVKKVRIPGIEQLHTKPLAEVAEALSIVLKSHSNVTQFTWKLGSHIELTINQT